MGEVKIISGKWGKRKIKTPEGSTHPMGERERNALFNMLGQRIERARVADFYAGSGALGIEALSRGAESCLFVEKNPAAMRVITDNCALLQIPKDHTSFYCGSVQSFYKKPKNPASAVFQGPYDVILADPPYNNFDDKELGWLSELLADGGVLVLSHPEEAPELNGVRLIDSRKYAGARLSFYAKD